MHTCGAARLVGCPCTSSFAALGRCLFCPASLRFAASCPRPCPCPWPRPASPHTQMLGGTVSLSQPPSSAPPAQQLQALGSSNGMGNVPGMVTAAGGGGMGGGGLGGGGMGSGVTGGSNLNKVVGGQMGGVAGAMGGGVCGAGTNMCAPSRRTRPAPFCALCLRQSPAHTSCSALPLHTRPVPLSRPGTAWARWERRSSARWCR